jgi:hypothetical protein
MGGCLSSEADASVKLPPQAASITNDPAVASAPSSNRSSELTSHMIRERHRNVWNCEYFNPSVGLIKY